LSERNAKTPKNPRGPRRLFEKRSAMGELGEGGGFPSVAKMPKMNRNVNGPGNLIEPQNIRLKGRKRGKHPPPQKDGLIRLKGGKTGD